MFQNGEAPCSLSNICNGEVKRTGFTTAFPGRLFYVDHIGRKDFFFLLGPVTKVLCVYFCGFLVPKTDEICKGGFSGSHLLREWGDYFSEAFNIVLSIEISLMFSLEGFHNCFLYWEVLKVP